MGTLRRGRRRLVRGIGKGTVGWLGRLGLSLLSRTWRIERVGEENLESATRQGPGCFVSLWHGRMIIGALMHARRDWHVLVSPSGDGDVSEKLLESLGYNVIRGSASRGGARALRKMLSVLAEGTVLVITPDGPRGPMHSMNPGLAWMARATGRAVIPSGFVCDRAWHANSWDNFTLPKPFARILLIYGEPLSVPRGADEAAQEEATAEIKRRMLAAEQRAFEHLGREVDWPKESGGEEG